MQSRDEVLDAALRCLKTDPTASMGDVAAAVGIGRATLHRHFWLGHASYGLLIASREALQAGDVARRALADLAITTFLDGAAAR
jgi:hypothetical protein